MRCISYVDEALALLEKTKPSEGALRDFHAEAGFVLFADLQFREAARMWKLSSVDPREVAYHWRVFKLLIMSRCVFVNVGDSCVPRFIGEDNAVYDLASSCIQIFGDLHHRNCEENKITIGQTERQNISDRAHSGFV